MIKYIFDMLNTIVKSIFYLDNWKKPSCKKLLIYDRAGTEQLINFFDKDDIIFLDVRFTNNKSLNFYIIIKLILKLKLSQKNYKNEFIKYSDPKYVLSLTDTNFGYLKLKKKFPNIIFILIQRSWRLNIENQIIPLKNRNMISKRENEIDYFIVFNKAVGREFDKICKANYLDFGSFTNNNINILQKKKKYKYLLIGRNTDIQSSHSYWSKYFEMENRFYKKFFEYFRKNNKEPIHILGKSFDTSKAIKFYDKLLGKGSYIYIPRSQSSYDIMGTANYIFGSTSTLLYEALSRNFKVGVFSVTGRFKKLESSKFGWPTKLKEKGEFWTNSFETEEIDRVVTFIETVNNIKWKKLVYKRMNNILKYDRNNSRFISFSKKIGLPIKRK